MAAILDWNYVYLKQNPFADTPPRRPEEDRRPVCGRAEAEGLELREAEEAQCPRRPDAQLHRGLERGLRG